MCYYVVVVLSAFAFDFSPSVNLNAEQTATSSRQVLFAAQNLEATEP